MTCRSPNETTGRADVLTVMPPNSAVSDMHVSPTVVTSGGHFPCGASEISGIGVDTSALDSAFTSDVASSVGPDRTMDNGEGGYILEIPLIKCYGILASQT